MAEHKMVIIDGIRYREEDAPVRKEQAPAQHQAVQEPERPKRGRASRKDQDDKSDS